MLRICAGRFKGKRLCLPPNEITRPTSDRLRQAVFNILTNILSFEELNVLDGFAGSGALGLEALSRGANKATFCEINPLAGVNLNKNITSILNVSTYTVSVVKNFFQLRSSTPFDLVFLDPPYGESLEYKALQYLSDNKLLAKDSTIIIEQKKGMEVLVQENLKVHDQRIYGNCQITIVKSQ